MATNKLKLIIIADDDKDDLYFFAQVIREIDPSIKLTFVTDGVELLNLLQHVCPDLLFLDLEMPCKNGLECLVQIRRDAKLNNLPVVVFSSTHRPANIQASYDLGADLFLLKPSGFAAYKAAVQATLELDWDDPRKIREQHYFNNQFAAFG